MSIAGWTKRERTRRKEDKTPTPTTFRLDLIHVATVHYDAGLSPRIALATKKSLQNPKLELRMKPAEPLARRQGERVAQGKTVTDSRQ